MMARIGGYVKARWHALRAWHDAHPRTALSLLVVVVGVFAFASPIHATDIFGSIAVGGLSATFAPILALLAALMYAVVQFLIYLNMFFSDLLIHYAQYNDFVNARPVALGWPLIRDVVNMLFIIVLLAVAFSTIIGYEKLHYKHILPKLLLMAVLINFSKTLVGVMIDFSQVVTLTFVNGFKAAAFGNFVKAFGWTSFLDTVKATDVSSFEASLPTIGNTIISLLFGMIVLTVTATVLLIMTLYFLARMVILWILLIFSPIAFFAEALHGTPLEKALPHSATSEWWSKLSTALTGGPVVAFFLWLTLAVIQGADKPFDTLYRSADGVGNTNPTILSVSDPANFTTMLVAIALLLTGLNTAVSVSGSLDKSLGALAGKIKSSGGPAGLAARYVAKPVAGKLDRQFGISKKVGESLIDLGKGGGFLGRGIQNIGMRATAINSERKEKEKKAFSALSSHESPANQFELAKNMSKSLDPVTRETGEKMMFELADKLPFAEGDAALQYLAANAKSGKLKSDAAIKLAKGVDNSNKQNAIIADEQKRAMMKNGLTEAEVKEFLAAGEFVDASGTHDLDKEAKARAGKAAGEATALEVMRNRLTAGLTAAEKGDEASFTSLKNITKKGVHLEKDAAKRRSKIQEILGDPKRIRQNADPDVWTNTEAFDVGLAVYKGDLGRFQASEEYQVLSKGTSAPYLEAWEGALRDGLIAPGQALQMTKEKDGRISFADASGKTTNARGRVMEYIPPDTGPVKTVDAMVSNLSASLQQEVRAGLGGMSNPDAFADKVGYKIRPADARHIVTNSRAYVSPPAVPATGGGASLSEDAIQAISTAYIPGQARGIPAPDQYRGYVMSAAVSEIRYGTDDESRVEAVQALANTNMSDIVNDTTLQQQTYEALNGQMEHVRKAFQQKGVEPEVFKNLEGFVQSIDRAAKAAQAKDPTTSTPLDAHMVDLRKQMVAEGILDKVSRRTRASSTS